MRVTIAETTRADLAFVLAAERCGHARAFVTQWSIEQHADAIVDSDQEHLLIVESGAPAGFVLLAGVCSPHEGIELRRIVIMRPGVGLGRLVLGLVLARAFDGHGVHRVWLDVKPENHRARHVYSSVGFELEGTTQRECECSDDTCQSLLIMSMGRWQWTRAREAAGSS